jgi:hypothetical protein
MRYIFIGLILVGILGCNSNGTKSGEGLDKVPSSPITKDSSKKPPSIPAI